MLKSFFFFSHYFYTYVLVIKIVYSIVLQRVNRPTVKPSKKLFVCVNFINFDWFLVIMLSSVLMCFAWLCFCATTMFLLIY